MVSGGTYTNAPNVGGTQNRLDGTMGAAFTKQRSSAITDGALNTKGQRIYLWIILSALILIPTILSFV